jgi:tRNA dimethylallyltransferase
MVETYDDVKPVIYVLGTTGVGKSKIAIEIAKRFSGEIVNADSMQIYKGQGIMTA